MQAFTMVLDAFPRRGMSNRIMFFFFFFVCVNQKGCCGHGLKNAFTANIIESVNVYVFCSFVSSEVMIICLILIKGWAMRGWLSISLIQA